MDLEGPELEALKARAKKQLRSRARSLRGAIPRSALALRSAAIVARLEGLPEVRAAHSLALFWPMEDRGEVDLRAFGAGCRARGQLTYFPYFGPTYEECGFALVNADEELEERGRGFAEPAPGADSAAPDALDVIVVPALAVAPTGHRLGYGAGFYDGVLPRFTARSRTVVVAYDFELLAELPFSPHDVACDFVVTDAQTFVPSSPEGA